MPESSLPARRRLRMAVWIAFALLTGLVISVAVSLLRYDREQALRRTESELLSLTRVLEEHVARSFGETDNAIADLALQLASQGGVDALTEKELHTLLRQRDAHLPQAEYLYVEREDGSTVADSFELIVPRAGTADSRHRTTQASHNSDMEIGAPTRSRHSVQWITPLTRRIADPGGKFAGLVGAAMSHDYFEGVYRDLQLSADDTILVQHAGRALTLIRHPQVDALVGQSSGNAALALGPDQRSAIVTGADGPDQPERITAYRRLADYPLVVGTSRPVEQALADYYANRNRIVCGAAAMLTLLGALAFMLHRDSLRRDGERQSLAELNATLEERVRTRTEELEQSNRELISFSYSISHDLRAPLRAINGFSHMLEEEYGGQLEGEGKMYLSRVRKASVRMGELIDELLKLASVSRQPLKIQQTDVSAMAKEILDDMAAEAPDRAVHVHVEPSLSAEADPNLLRNALQNLLANAWKFSRDSNPALIQVGGRLHGQEKLFYVTDNGVGFEIAHATKLFHPFQQLHKRAGFEGSGIGLASVRRIVERHGGNIWAESSPGAGTTIFFTLPRSPAMVRRPREREQAQG